MRRVMPIRCRIPELLVRIGKSRAWLTEQTGYPRQRISDYVNMQGNTVMLMPIAKVFANALGCKIDDLYEWPDQGIGGG